MFTYILAFIYVIMYIICIIQTYSVDIWPIWHMYISTHLIYSCVYDIISSICDVCVCDTDIKLWLWKASNCPICFSNGLPLNLVLHILAALNLLLLLCSSMYRYIRHDRNSVDLIYHVWWLWWETETTCAPCTYLNHLPSNCIFYFLLIRFDFSITLCLWGWYM